jgi:hypothetical protein
LAAGDPLKAFDELAQYREIVEGEIRNHRLFSRITLLTGAGLIVLGTLIAFYSPDLISLGYLLLFAGVLRFLNTFYDLQREDPPEEKSEAYRGKIRERRGKTVLELRQWAT